MPNRTTTTNKFTLAQANAYQRMFDWFNEQLFNDELPQVLLTFTRRPRVAGHFAAERWEAHPSLGGKAHEISLNPAELLKPLSAAQTIVHEMCHLWQFTFGDVPRRGYHDRQFAEKMKSIGLQPSSTGAIGGAETGQHMSDYPIEGGAFLLAFKKMPRECTLPWRGLPEAEPKAKDPKPSSKTKFTCPNCQQNAWGKPDLVLVCGACTDDADSLVRMEAAS